jgi:hypothetical protein
MKNVLHPNMFPHAGETVSMAALTARADDTPAQNPEGQLTGSASPWANPVDSLQKAVTVKNVTIETEKALRLSRVDQVIDYLRVHGPSRGREICDALGIRKDAGISPFVSSALKDGRIEREGSYYMLPGQKAPQATRAAAPVNAEPAASDASPRAASERAPDSAAPASIALGADAPPAKLGARQPDFTLAKDDAMLTSWPDGAITVQRGGSLVELTASHVKLISTLIELRRQ